MTRKQLSPAVEDYLETILELDSEGQAVRSVEIADHLGISRAAVSKAMVNLSHQGLVEHALYGRIQLTAEGQKRAAEILNSHRMLKQFLTELLGVSQETAEQDACRLEHVICEETRSKWLAYIEQTLRNKSADS